MSYILFMTFLLVSFTIIMGIKGIKTGIKTGRAQVFLGLNMATFFILMVGVAILVFSGNTAHAAETVSQAGSGDLKFIGAALSTGLACIGTGIAVAMTGSAAIGGISEDPKLLGKTIIFVGLAEGIAIYGLIISIMILQA